MVLKSFSSNESMVDAKCKDLAKGVVSQVMAVEEIGASSSSSTCTENSETDCADSSATSRSELRKPFFVMDWLDEVDSDSIQLAQEILRTPQKIRSIVSPMKPSQASAKNSLSPLRTNLCAAASLSPFAKRSISIGNGYNAKGIQKARLGEWEAALACWEDALEIRKQVGKDLDVANTCNNIGIALGKLNRTEEAIKVLQHALMIRKDHFGTEHSEVAATLHNLGNVYQKDGDPAAAIQCFCECKVLQEAIHGTPNQVEVARACVAIGHTYFQAEAFADAREAYMDALNIFEKIGYGSDHPEVQTTKQDVQDLENTVTIT